MRRIIQIPPAATGTLARFKTGDELVCETIDVWALVEDEDGDRDVVGVSSSQQQYLDFVDEEENFHSYVMSTKQARG